jgi:hypothetical protein
VDCFVASRLARTTNQDVPSRPRGAMRPRRCFIFRPFEGVGNAGCPLHPRPRVRFAFGKKHTSIRVHRNHPAFPHAMVLTAYVALSPVTGLFCHRRLRIKFCLSPVGPTQLRELDASVGASGPHDFAVRCNISRPRAVDHSRIQRTRPAIHRTLNAAASTASRPNVRDDHDTPLSRAGMARVIKVIWGA